MEKLVIKLNRVQEEILKLNGFITVEIDGENYVVIKYDEYYLLSKPVKEPFEILFTDEVSNETN